MYCNFKKRRNWKIKSTIKEQDGVINFKENELKKLRSSYKEIENFFENATTEKEFNIKWS